MVKVVCALIFKNEKILIAQRAERMTNPLKWEFPGGKMLDNETAFNAIKRECKEELGIMVEPLKKGTSIFHSYPHISIELIPIYCHQNDQPIHLSEHIHYRFISSEELMEFDFSDADIKIIKANYLS